MTSKRHVVLLTASYLALLIFLLERPLIIKSAVLAFSLLFFALAFAIYRLYFSPLSHIPGPKLAAITQLYEIYYDIYLGGQYMLHFKSLHQKYGMVLGLPVNLANVFRTHHPNYSVGSAHQRS